MLQYLTKLKLRTRSGPFFHISVVIPFQHVGIEWKTFAGGIEVMTLIKSLPSTLIDVARLLLLVLKAVLGGPPILIYM